MCNIYIYKNTHFLCFILLILFLFFASNLFELHQCNNFYHDLCFCILNSLTLVNHKYLCVSAGGWENRDTKKTIAVFWYISSSL